MENYIDMTKREFQTLAQEIKRKWSSDEVASFFNN